jgi:hypothetical protein
MGPMTGGGFGLCRPGRARAGDRQAAYPQGYGMRGAGRGLAPWGGGRGRVWGGGRGGAFTGVGRAGAGPGAWGGWGRGSRSGARAFDAAPWDLAEARAAAGPGDELEYLRRVLSGLEEDMKAVRGRITDLEAKHEK